MDESAVELYKANEFGNIPDLLGLRPSSEKLMLGLGWTITIRAHIIADEFESLGKDEALSQTQGKAICQTDTELTSHIEQRGIKVMTMTENVIHNDLCICPLID
jgi:hypothetical protein